MTHTLNAPIAETASSEPAPLAQWPGAGRRGVLVVEDEAAVRLATAQALREAGYAVHEAATADEAVASIRAGLKPDIVLTDIKLPGALDGWELAKELAACAPRTRVFATSGYAADVDPGLVAAFISKPYNTARLVELFAEAAPNAASEQAMRARRQAVQRAS